MHIKWMGNEHGNKTHSKSITIVHLITRNNQSHTSDYFLDATPDLSIKHIPNSEAHNTVQFSAA
jgi:hypothetical protein